MANKAPEFVFIESSETKGTLILCTRAPYPVAQVWMFRTQEELDAFMNNCNVPAVTQIAEYRILLVYQYTLQYMPYHHLKDTVLHEFILAMAKWFLTERIRPHEPRYNKYKIL